MNNNITGKSATILIMDDPMYTQTMKSQLAKAARMAIMYGMSVISLKQRLTPEEFDVPYHPVPYGSRVARPIPKRVSGKRAWKMRGKRPS